MSRPFTRYKRNRLNGRNPVVETLLGASHFYPTLPIYPTSSRPVLPRHRVVLTLPLDRGRHRRSRETTVLSRGVVAHFLLANVLGLGPSVCP